MFAKSTLASAVAAAIGVSAVGIAQADTLFFPQVVMSDTVTTIASVINKSNDNYDSAGNAWTGGQAYLHYRFYYKSGENVGNPLASCEEYNEYLPTSVGDIQTVDLSGHFGSDTQAVLFNDPSINNNWAGTSRDYAFGRYVTPARGYLYVDNAADSSGADISGEAFVFEFGSGAAWGYQAFSNGDASYVEAASKSPSDVPLMPFDEITTAFFVTPVSTNQAPDTANEYRGRIEFYNSNGSSARGDLYDRDENLISGAVPQDVVCVARINASDLMSDGTLARVVDGGWGRLYNYRVIRVGGNWLPANIAGTTETADEMSLGQNTGNKANSTAGNVVIKLEYNLGDTFNGESVGGTYNNAVMYRH